MTIQRIISEEITVHVLTTKDKKDVTNQKMTNRKKNVQRRHHFTW